MFEFEPFPNWRGFFYYFIVVILKPILYLYVIVIKTNRDMKKVKSIAVQVAISTPAFIAVVVAILNRLA